MSRTKKGLLKGAKISRKHSSVIEAATPIILVAKALPEVSKVVLSEIVRIRAGRNHLKFSQIPAGLRVVVRGANSQQTLFVYTNKPTSVQHSLLRAWQEAGYI